MADFSHLHTKPSRPRLGSRPFAGPQVRAEDAPTSPVPPAANPNVGARPFSTGQRLPGAMNSPAPSVRPWATPRLVAVVDATDAPPESAPEAEFESISGHTTESWPAPMHAPVSEEIVDADADATTVDAPTDLSEAVTDVASSRAPLPESGVAGEDLQAFQDVSENAWDTPASRPESSAWDGDPVSDASATESEPAINDAATADADAPATELASPNDATGRVTWDAERSRDVDLAGAQYLQASAGALEQPDVDAAEGRAWETEWEAASDGPSASDATAPAQSDAVPAVESNNVRAESDETVEQLLEGPMESWPGAVDGSGLSPHEPWSLEGDGASDHVGDAVDPRVPDEDELNAIQAQLDGELRRFELQEWERMPTATAFPEMEATAFEEQASTESPAGDRGDSRDDIGVRSIGVAGAKRDDGASSDEPDESPAMSAQDADPTVSVAHRASGDQGRERIADVLESLAARVRQGEIPVSDARQARNDAATLAAVLSALLGESD